MAWGVKRIKVIVERVDIYERSKYFSSFEREPAIIKRNVMREDFSQLSTNFSRIIFTITRFNNFNAGKINCNPTKHPLGNYQIEFRNTFTVC